MAFLRGSYTSCWLLLYLWRLDEGNVYVWVRRRYTKACEHFARQVLITFVTTVQLHTWHLLQNYMMEVLNNTPLKKFNNKDILCHIVPVIGWRNFNWFLCCDISCKRTWRNLFIFTKYNQLIYFSKRFCCA